MSITISTATWPKDGKVKASEVLTRLAEAKFGLSREEAELFTKLVEAMGATMAYDFDLEGEKEQLVRELLADNPPPTLEVAPDLPGAVGL